MTTSMERTTLGRPAAMDGVEISGPLPTGSDRVVTLLDALIRAPQGSNQGVRELAHELGVSRSSASRILHELAEIGLAQRDLLGRYTPGPRIRLLTARIQHSRSIFSTGSVIVQELADSAAATATINFLSADGRGGFVAVRRSASGPIGYTLTPGTVLPLHAGATGRALLSAIGGKVVTDGHLTRYTELTTIDARVLEECSERDRRAGYVISIGQHFPAAAGLSAPFVVDGVQATVTITRPRAHATREDLEGYAPLIVEAARQLGRLSTPPFANVFTSSTVDDDPSDGGSSVVRLERFLAALTRHRNGLPTTGRALGRAIRVNPSTATKLRQNALHNGLAVHAGGALKIGPTLLLWSSILGSTVSIAGLARPVVEELSHRTGETVGLIELDYNTHTARQTVVVQGSQHMHYWMAEDMDVPLYAGASGKAILAFLDSSILARQRMIKFTNNTDIDPASVAAQLATIRERGWSTGNGERRAEAYGIAAPFFADGKVLGSITVTIPRLRMHEIDKDRIVVAVLESAAEISALLSID